MLIWAVPRHELVTLIAPSVSAYSRKSLEKYIQELIRAISGLSWTQAAPKKSVAPPRKLRFCIRPQRFAPLGPPALEGAKDHQAELSSACDGTWFEIIHDLHQGPASEPNAGRAWLSLDLHCVQNSE